MRECILTVGVSASGKTTWTEKFIQTMRTMEGEIWVDLNRDILREEIFKKKTGFDRFQWSQWKLAWEKEVTHSWKQRITDLCGYINIKGVVCSDTNLNPKTREFLINTFKAAKFNVQLKHFEIDYETAVKRDLNRHNPVGSSVIAQQLEKYWIQFGERYIPNATLTPAVIVDVDGTLAHRDNLRDVFDWNKVHLDRPDFLVTKLVQGLRKEGVYIVVVSGRDDVCKEKTWQWLYHTLGFEPSALYMRKTGDHRKDCIVKREIFFRDIAPKYCVIGAIDDRPQVVRLYHSLGVRVLACGLQHIEF